MADRHRDHSISKEKEKEIDKDKEKEREKEKEKKKDGSKGAVVGIIGGCPVLIQTGPNVKVLAQVCTVRATPYYIVSYCTVLFIFFNFHCFSSLLLF